MVRYSRSARKITQAVRAESTAAGLLPLLQHWLPEDHLALFMSGVVDALGPAVDCGENAVHNSIVTGVLASAAISLPREHESESGVDSFVSDFRDSWQISCCTHD